MREQRKNRLGIRNLEPGAPSSERSAAESKNRVLFRREWWETTNHAFQKQKNPNGRGKGRRKRLRSGALINATEASANVVDAIVGMLRINDFKGYVVAGLEFATTASNCSLVRGLLVDACDHQSGSSGLQQIGE